MVHISARLLLPIFTVVAYCGCTSINLAQERSPTSFERFLQDEVWPEAEARGITRPIFLAAFANISPDPQVLALTKTQPEYTKPVGRYLGSRVAPEMISSGRRQVTNWSAALARIERNFGVEPSILVSIWGLESSYGGVKDNRDVIRSLATLAFAGYRVGLFRNELLFALAILQAGDVPRERLVGSWAGAMGQPQFLPSSFVENAVDFSKDGRRDIWTNTPDVLASIANYLHKRGWKHGLPWGYETIIPSNFDFGRSRSSFRGWATSGFRRADGGAFPDDTNADADAYLLFPSGAQGPAFLVTENFVTIKQYNNSDVYALAVAHLSDRLRGLGPIRGRWPDNDHPLSREQRIELQRGLAAAGYKVSDFEGHIDFDLRDAIREVQLAAGMVRDGNPTLGLLERVRVGRLRP